MNGFSSIIALNKTLLNTLRTLYDPDFPDFGADFEKGLANSAVPLFPSLNDWIAKVARTETLRSAMRDLPPSAAKFAANLILWVSSPSLAHLLRNFLIYSQVIHQLPKVILNPNEAIHHLPEKIKLLQDVCVFGGCLPSFVTMDLADAHIPNPNVSLVGGEASIVRAVRGDEQFAIREDHIVMSMSGSDKAYRRWIQTQVCT